MVFTCDELKNREFVYSMIPAESEMSFPKMLYPLSEKMIEWSERLNMLFWIDVLSAPDGNSRSSPFAGAPLGFQLLELLQKLFDAPVHWRSVAAAERGIKRRGRTNAARGNRLGTFMASPPRIPSILFPLSRIEA